MIFVTSPQWVNTLRPRQNGRHLPDEFFKYIFFNENVWISIKISLRFVPKGSINNIPTLVQIMAWRRPGDKPLSEPMMVSSLTHIWVTGPQCVHRSTPNTGSPSPWLLYSCMDLRLSNIPCKYTFKANLQGDVQILYSNTLHIYTLLSVYHHPPTLILLCLQYH